MGTVWENIIKVQNMNISYNFFVKKGCSEKILHYVNKSQEFKDFWKKNLAFFFQINKCLEKPPTYLSKLTLLIWKKRENLWDGPY